MVAGAGYLRINKKAQPNKTKTFVRCHKSSAEQQEAVNLGRWERRSQSPSQSAPFWFSTELFNCVSRVSISQAQFQGHAWLLSLAFWSCLPAKTHNWDRGRLFLIHVTQCYKKKEKNLIFRSCFFWFCKNYIKQKLISSGGKKHFILKSLKYVLIAVCEVERGMQ